MGVTRSRMLSESVLDDSVVGSGCFNAILCGVMRVIPLWKLC